MMFYDMNFLISGFFIVKLLPMDMYLLCHLLSLILFACQRGILSSAEYAKGLYTDQLGHNVWPDLDPNHLTLIVLLKDFFENFNFEKSQQTAKKS